MDPNLASQPIQPMPQTPIAPPIIEGPPPRKKMPTLLALILLVVIVIALGGGTYVMNMKKTENPKPTSIAKAKPSPKVPTPSPTTPNAIPSGWKTFTDPSTNLSFQYPPDLEVLVQNAAKSKNAPQTIVELGKNHNLSIGFYYYPNEKDLSLKELDKTLTVTDDMRGTWNPQLSSADNQPITIGNNISAYFNGKTIDCEPVACERYLIQQKGKVFKVLIVSPYGTKDPICQQILSTVRFTDQKQATDTSDWKTYTDGTYYSIKYPSTWTLKSSYNLPGDVMIYDPKSIVARANNGSGSISYPTKFINILSAEASKQTAMQVFEEYKQGWEKNNTKIQSEDGSKNGTNLILYDNMGEGSVGKNVAISNGSLLVKINTSINTLQEVSTENQMLQTFTLLK